MAFEVKNDVLIKYIPQEDIKEIKTEDGIAKVVLKTSTVIVPDGVEVIGKGCFQSSICDVILPSSVTEIRDFAFDICNGSVWIPVSVVKISEYAFGDLEWRRAALQKAIEEGALKNPNPPIVQSVIKTTENSTAHIFAVEHGIPFELV